MVSNEMIEVSGIQYSSAVDGPGFRDVLFVSYCPHHCPGCHNRQTWEHGSGEWRTIDDVYRDLTKSDVCNVTFSGGEPFEQASALTELAKRLRKEKGKTIWIYSGYLLEQILEDPEKKALLELCDVLVDGPFVEAEKGLNIRFKGSKNQRILDVKKSLAAGEAVLWEG